jgi:hypothetical protein
VAFADDIAGSHKIFSLHDTAGRRLGEAVAAPGARSLEIDLKALTGYDLPCGVYFATVLTPTDKATIKVVVIR